MIQADACKVKAGERLVLHLFEDIFLLTAIGWPLETMCFDFWNEATVELESRVLAQVVQGESGLLDRILLGKSYLCDFHACMPSFHVLEIVIGSKLEAGES